MITARQLRENAKGISVLYVEDDDDLRLNTTRLLTNFFSDVDTARNGKEGLIKYYNKNYDLVITDINMPLVDGVKMARQIRADNDKQIIIVISAHDEATYLLDLINMGVDSFVLKPLDLGQFLEVLDKSIKLVKYNQLEEDYKRNLEEMIKVRTGELSEVLEIVKELSGEIVHRLTAAAELRDPETGAHNKRLGIYAPKLAQCLGMSNDFVESIAFAAPLHDIGKIGIWDRILLKPGPLTAEEFELMKNHTITGANILKGSSYYKIRMIESIALTHHERWDGTGYPRGLKGEEIPIEGRIVSICDQYDALRSKRPYKPEFTHDKAVDILINGDEKTRPGAFDPRVLEAFTSIAADFDQIFCSNRD
ncbi:MAG: HD domain-containing phosphohydrolase [Syntrophomonadaceae bacterium]